MPTRSAAELAQCHRDGHLLPASDELHWYLLSGPEIGEDRDQHVCGRGGLSVDLEDDVAGPDPRFGRGAPRHDRGYEYAATDDRRHAHAEVSPAGFHDVALRD